MFKTTSKTDVCCICIACTGGIKTITATDHMNSDHFTDNTKLIFAV